MILGRSTVQWTAVITAAGGLAQVLIVTLLPGIDPVVVVTIIGSLIAFLAVFIAFLANTSTTPTDDPRLKANTMVQVTDNAGTVIGHAPVPTPGPAPVEPDVSPTPPAPLDGAAG